MLGHFFSYWPISTLDFVYCSTGSFYSLPLELWSITRLPFPLQLFQSNSHPSRPNLRRFNDPRLDCCRPLWSDLRRLGIYVDWNQWSLYRCFRSLHKAEIRRKGEENVKIWSKISKNRKKITLLPAVYARNRSFRSRAVYACKQRVLHIFFSFFLNFHRFRTSENTVSCIIIVSS